MKTAFPMRKTGNFAGDHSPFAGNAFRNSSFAAFAACAGTVFRPAFAKMRACASAAGRPAWIIKMLCDNRQEPRVKRGKSAICKAPTAQLPAGYWKWRYGGRRYGFYVCQYWPRGRHAHADRSGACAGKARMRAALHSQRAHGGAPYTLCKRTCPRLFWPPGAAGKRGPCPAGEIDLILVPCLAADDAGYRLGYGGGYYDRFLAGAKGVSICLCREQALWESVPRDAHDARVDFVVTEAGTIAVEKEA